MLEMILGITSSAISGRNSRAPGAFEQRSSVAWIYGSPAIRTDSEQEQMNARICLFKLTEVRRTSLKVLARDVERQPVRACDANLVDVRAGDEVHAARDGGNSALFPLQ